MAVLPSDHHYSDEAAFTVALESAFETARRHRDSVVLLGSPAGGAQTEYGWLETGPSLDGRDGSTFLVRRFCEKPSLELAELLYERGALWNTFVMVGHVSAYLEDAGRLRTQRSPEGFSRSAPLGRRGRLRFPPGFTTAFIPPIFRVRSCRIESDTACWRSGWATWSGTIWGNSERVMDVLDAAGLKPWWMKDWCALRRPPGMEVPASTAAVA